MHNTDQVSSALNFGVEGCQGPVKLKLSHGFGPGGVLTVVAYTDHHSHISIKDASKNVLLTFGARTNINELVLNTQMNTEWGTEEKPKVAVKRGKRYTASFVYEQTGYRIFLNGEEIAFYKHRSTNEADRVEVTDSLVFQITYRNFVKRCI